MLPLKCPCATASAVSGAKALGCADGGSAFQRMSQKFTSKRLIGWA